MTADEAEAAAIAIVDSSMCSLYYYRMQPLPKISINKLFIAGALNLQF